MSLTPWLLFCIVYFTIWQLFWGKRTLTLPNRFYDIALPPTIDFCLIDSELNSMSYSWKGLWKFYPSKTLGILYDLTGSRNSRWRTRPDRNLTLNTCLSWYRQHRNEIWKTISMFSRSGLSNKSTRNIVRPEVGNPIWRHLNWKNLYLAKLVVKVGTKVQRKV